MYFLTFKSLWKKKFICRGANWFINPIDEVSSHSSINVPSESCHGIELQGVPYIFSASGAHTEELFIAIG